MHFAKYMLMTHTLRLADARHGPRTFADLKRRFDSQMAGRVTKVDCGNVVIMPLAECLPARPAGGDDGVERDIRSSEANRKVLGEMRAYLTTCPELSVPLPTLTGALSAEARAHLRGAGQDVARFVQSFPREFLLTEGMDGSEQRVVHALPPVRRYRKHRADGGGGDGGDHFLADADAARAAESSPSAAPAPPMTPASAASSTATCQAGCWLAEMQPALLGVALASTSMSQLARVSWCCRALRDSMLAEGRLVISCVARMVLQLDRLVSLAARAAGARAATHWAPFIDLLQVVLCRPRVAPAEKGKTIAHFWLCTETGAGESLRDAPDRAQSKVRLDAQRALGLVELDYIVDTNSDRPFARAETNSTLPDGMPHFVALLRDWCDDVRFRA